VRDRAEDPTTFGLELSARMKPEKAIERVLDCYKEGLRDPDSRIRHIHIDRLLCTMSAKQIIMRQFVRESYMARLIDTLEDGRMFEGSCGLCEHFGSTPQHDGDCWKSHPIKSEQHTTATSRRHFRVRKKRLSIRDSVTDELRTSVSPKKVGMKGQGQGWETSLGSRNEPCSGTKTVVSVQAIES
jgi:hypothetical protein